jgi:RND family efflux transporter MFP subunit
MKPLASALAVVVAVVAVPACHHDAVAPPQPTAVKVAVVESATNAAGTHYSAQINPATKLDVSFKVGGYVDSVATVAGVDGKPRVLQEGDAVRANMQLAMIRRTDYVQKLAEAQASIAQAKAGLDEAQLDFDRTDRLAKTNAVAGAELDSARTKRDSAAATLAGAKARLDQAATALADTSLRSPLDGIVIKRAIEVGALASPGTVAFTVADVGSVKAAFGVPDTVLPRIHLGAVETVTTEAFPGETFAGRISLIAPSADAKSRVFEVDITIPNADGRLKPGSVAALSLEGAGDATDVAPLIPLSAIVRAPGHADRFAVFVVGAPVAGAAHPVVHATEVELGEYLGKVIPVRRGLKGGETVVVQGAGLLSDGEPVEVIQ